MNTDQKDKYFYNGKFYDSRREKKFLTNWPYWPRVCQLEDCFEIHHGKGFCRTHYEEQRNPTRRKTTKKPPAAKKPVKPVYAHKGCGGVLRPVPRTRTNKYQCDTCTLIGVITEVIPTAKT
jgi:hypothetical protein